MSSNDYKCVVAILEAIDKIDEYSNTFKNANELFNDNKTFDAILMNFILIGEMVEKTSESLKLHYKNIDWLNIKGFRNIVAHNYFGVDAEEVWQIIREKLPQLKKNMETIREEIT